MILITGGAGFIGSNLVDALINLGYQVRVLDNESAKENDNFYWNPKADNHLVDIANYELTRHLYDGVDLVYHFAATSRIQRSVEDPISSAITNLFATQVVFQCAKEAGVERLIFASSSSIYGNNPTPNTEDQYPDCLTEYSASKLFGESLCNSYYKTYGIKTVALRFFNVYGDRQPLKGMYAPIIGLFMKQKESGLPLTIVGDGNQTRTFTHIEDILSACIRAGIIIDEDSVFGKVYNVGAQESHSINQIASMISDKTINIPERIGEAKNIYADSSKFIKDFSWNPKIKLAEWLNNNG